VPQAALGIGVNKGRNKNAHGGPCRQTGFSLIEVVVAMVIALILMVAALPSFLRAYHFYQLNHAATQVADILRLTRYEAIRRNRPLRCVFQPDAANPAIIDGLMTDTSGAPLSGVAAMMVMLGASGSLVDVGSVAGAGALPAAANLGPTAPANVPAGGVTLQFDARGALTTGNATVFYLENTGAPDAGFRAVLLMPSGSLQIWAADSAGNWRQLR
jgi:prepilin-type N-terminal cleavage/methylation domain-containing protein